jgi:hypothetical protein
MNLSRIPFLSVAVVIALAGYACPLRAGEKIQFSGSNKEKNNDLAAPRNKPLLPTLDFKQLTGHGATVSPEQLAPVPPPQEPLVDTKALEKSKKDRDWLNADKTEHADADNRDGKGDDRKKDRANRDKNGERERDKQKEKEQEKLRDPFDNSTRDRYDLDASSAGSSTNRISFSSGSRRPESPFESRASSGSMENNSPGASLGRPRGSQSAFENSRERNETLKMLGITPSGSQNNLNQPSALNLLNGSQPNNTGRPLDITAGKSGFGPNNGNQFSGRDGGFKSSVGDANIGGLGTMAPNQGVPAYEPPKIERKPAVLPMPQRKF